MVTSLSKKLAIAILLVMLAIAALTPLTQARAASQRDLPKEVAGDNFYAVAALSRVFAPQIAKGLPLPQTVRSLFGDKLDAFIQGIPMASTQLSTTRSRIPELVHEIEGW